MEINFKDIELSDRSAVQKILTASNRRFCEVSFANIFCWAPVSKYKIAICGDTLILGKPEQSRFVMPIGKNRKEAVEELKRQYPHLTVRGASEEELCYLDGFEITEETGFFDYIYETQKLSALSGKKLAAKRNHINAFLADGEWHTEIITPDHCKILSEFNEKWCEGRCEESSLGHEMCAVNIALKNYEALGLSGLMLYKNGRLVAYSYGEPINHDTFCVHVEKADQDVRGAYQMINREFVRTFCDGYTYVNREDDAGDEGLKKAKLSYYPTNFGRKFKGTL